MLDIVVPSGENRKARRKVKKVASLPALRSFERGLNFFYVTQTVMRGTRRFVWPVLYFIVPEGDHLHIVRLETLLDYFEEHTARSHQWRLLRARGVGLMIDSSVSRLNLLSDRQRADMGEPIERYLLKQFALDVAHGTITLHENDTKTDRSNLFWHARGKEADKLLRAVSSYIEWLGENTGAKRWTFAASVDDVRQNPVTAFRMAAELAIRRKKSFLSYLGGEERAPSHRFAATTGTHDRSSNPIYSFPTKYFSPMLFEAFRTDDGEVDHAAQLIAHILLAGGLRSSEPFHFFVSDVQFMADEPVVFMHHPEFGKILDRNRSTDRKGFLLKRYEMLPRTKQSGARRAGWKSVLGDDVGTPIFWLPIPGLLERITELLRNYILRIRPAIMRGRAPHLKDHPFLFVNPRDSTGVGGGQIGDPYTISAFKGAWNRGVGRLARFYDDPDLAVLKAKGTTPHGPRHLYGRFLRTLELQPDVIQQAMHHRSVFSQEVYTRLSSSELNHIIKKSAERPDAPEMAVQIMNSVANFRNHYQQKGF